MKKLYSSLLLAFLLLFLLIAVSCSSSSKYEKEIIGAWEMEEYTLFFLSDGDIAYDNVDELPIGIFGSYIVDKDGVVNIQTIDGYDEWILQMYNEGDDWYLAYAEDNERMASRISNDVAYWEKTINDLDQGDRLEGTTWSADLEYGHNTLIYNADNTFEMDGANYYSGTYTSYYGRDAIVFLLESEESLLVPFSDFQYTEGTFYADEVQFDDGGHMVDYGFLSGDTMETAGTGDDHKPVYYYKEN